MGKEIYVIDIEPDRTDEANDDLEKVNRNIDRLGKSIDRLKEQMKRFDRTQISIEIDLKDQRISSFIKLMCRDKGIFCLPLRLETKVEELNIDFHLEDILKSISELRESISNLPFYLTADAWKDASAPTTFNGLKRYARGGFLNGPHIGIVGEEGPEAIIPLSASRRERGRQLWYETGMRLGTLQSDTGYIPINNLPKLSTRLGNIEMYANGGIVGEYNASKISLEELKNEILGLNGDNIQSLWVNIIKMVKDYQTGIKSENLSNAADVMSNASSIFGWTDSLANQIDIPLVSSLFDIVSKAITIKQTNPIEKGNEIIDAIVSAGYDLVSMFFPTIHPVVSNVLKIPVQFLAGQLYDLFTGIKAEKDREANLKRFVSNSVVTVNPDVKEILKGYAAPNLKVSQDTYTGPAVNGHSYYVGNNNGIIRGMVLDGEKALFVQSKEIFEANKEKFISLSVWNTYLEKEIEDTFNYLDKLENEYKKELDEICKRYWRRKKLEKAFSTFIALNGQQLNTKTSIGISAPKPNPIDISAPTPSPIEDWKAKLLALEDPCKDATVETLKDITDEAWLTSPEENFRLLTFPYYNKLMVDFLNLKVNTDKIEKIREYANTSVENLTLDNQLVDIISNSKSKNALKNFSAFMVGLYGVTGDSYGKLSDNAVKLYNDAFDMRIKGYERERKQVKSEDLSETETAAIYGFNEAKKSLLDTYGFDSLDSLIAAYKYGDFTPEEKKRIKSWLLSMINLSNLAPEFLPRLNIELREDPFDLNMEITKFPVVDQPLKELPDDSVYAHAKGGIFTSTHMGLIAESGPEAVIPLSGKYKDRGIEIWHGVGNIFGIGSEAIGTAGIYDDKNSQAEVYEPAPKSLHSDCVEINVGGIGGLNFTINTSSENPEGLVESLREEMPKIANEVADTIAVRLKQAYSNMPLE